MLPPAGGARRGESIRASEAQDVWSLGMTMHFVLTGKVPFSELDDDATIEAMCDPALHVDVSHIQDEAARHAREVAMRDEAAALREGGGARDAGAHEDSVRAQPLGVEEAVSYTHLTLPTSDLV